MPNIEEERKTWGHPYFGRVVWIVALGASIWLVCRPQTTGVAIGTLGAVAAIVAFLRLGPRAKVLWTVVIFLLLISEFRAISKQNAQFIADKKALNIQFKGIRDSENLHFEATVGKLQTAIDNSHTQFENTIRPLKETLAATQQALSSAKAAELNTLPRANIERVAILSNRAVQSPTLYASLTPQDFTKPEVMQIVYLNNGTAVASDFFILGRMYLGRPGNLSDEIMVSSQFDRDWSAHRFHSAISIPPSTRPYSAPLNSDGFQEGELDSIAHGTMAIYYFLRFEYTDATGKWYRDYCGWFDYSPVSIDRASTCSVTSPNRYPVPSAPKNSHPPPSIKRHHNER